MTQKLGEENVEQRTKALAWDEGQCGCSNWGGGDDVRGQPGQMCASSATVRGLSVSLWLEVPGGL